MSVTILEGLMCAETNIDNAAALGLGILPLAKKQLHNAITLLEKGYSIDDEVEPLLKKYGSADDVPQKG